MKHFFPIEVREAPAPGIERRGHLPSGTLEYRAATADKPGEVTGYAVVWGAQAKLPWFSEEIRKGAFSESLASNLIDPMALAHHEWDSPLARRSAGTLTLTEDDKGLLVKFTLPDTTDGRDMAENLRNKNVKGFSFGMIPTTVEWKMAATGGQELDHRTIVKADLYEVSLVTMPAYDDTTVELAERSLGAAKKEAKPAGDTVSLATRKAQVACLELAEMPE